MIAFAFYLLKVFVCSGILTLYYLVALKDKAFHQWNRFYLLLAVALSIALPLVQIIVATTAEKSAAIQLIQVVQSADDYMEAITISSRPFISTGQWIAAGYAFASLLLFTAAVFSLVKIYRLAKKWGVQKVEGIRFINTAEPGTPFSFWRSVFWNREIPLHSETGRQIFQHELVHIKEKHTLDALFLQAVMMVFWCNPFFWLIKKELRFIHEFIADKQSVGEADTAAFATMILQAAYPSQYSSLVNPFFQTSIKRRLLMLTKMQNPRLNYTVRIVALPLIALVAFAFTLRTKDIPKAVKLNKEFVVVIDAGHGKKDGHFTGATGGDVYEDVLALTLAKKIGEFNTNPNIKIVFTRSDENIVDLKERVAIAQAAKADMLLSIHLNALPPTTATQRQTAPKENVEGIQVYVPAGTSTFGVQSTMLGSSVAGEMSTFYKTNATLLTPKQSIYVLASAPCPAVLIECGTINNEKDRAFITSPGNQEKFAKHILSAIERYAAAKEKDTGLHIDTLPKKQIESVDVNKAKGMLTVYYTDGSCETVTELEANNRGLITNGGYGNVSKSLPANTTAKVEMQITKLANKPLLVVNGQEISYELMPAINPSKIQSINVLKDDGAVAKYGAKGTNGVIEVIVKDLGMNEKIWLRTDSLTYQMDSLKIMSVKGNVSASFNINGPITIESENRMEVDFQKYPELLDDGDFQKSDIEPTVNAAEWRKHLEKQLVHFITNAANQSMKPGKYTVSVRFLVEKDGSISDVKALNDPGYGLAEGAVRTVRIGPKWKPGEQNGKTVRSYHTQPITFMISNQ